MIGSRRRLVVVLAGLAALVVVIPEAALERARALVERRRHDAAGGWLAVASWLSPRRGMVHVLAARIARRQERFADLRRELIAARDWGWPVADLEREQWIALAQSGQVESMESHWGELFLAPGSDGPEICRAFTVAALKRCRIADARRVLEAWAGDYPADPGPHLLTATIHEVQREWADAEREYSQAIRLAAADGETSRTARRGLATALMNRLRYDEALAAWDGLLAVLPGDEAARVGRSECLLAMGRVDEARDVVADVLADEPASVPARALAGRIELAAGKPRAAADHLAIAVASKPEDAELRYALGRALRLTGRDAEAEPHLAYRAEAEEPLNRLRSLENRIPERPWDADLRADIAALTARWKSRVEGLRWFRTALDVDPAHERSLAAIATLEAADSAGSRPPLPAPHAHKSDGPAAGGDGVTRDETIPPGAGTTVGVRIESIDPAGAGPQGIRLVDRAAERGLVFTAVNGQESERLTILESLGSGVAAIDLDGDGDDDLCLAGGGRFQTGSSVPLPAASGLFRNDGSGRFTDVTHAAGLGEPGCYSHGVTAGDSDGDGFCDLVITGYDGVELLQNLGDGTFRRVPREEHGIDGRGWNTSAAWLDADGDGALDLYLVRYVDWSPTDDPPCTLHGRRDVCPPAQFSGVTDRLFRSDAAGGFVEAGEAFGIAPGGKGLGVVASDLDLDGDTDLFIANDTTPNRLYRNTGGAFEECGLVAGVAVGPDGEPEGSMGVDCGDATLDGLPDLWVANFENQSFGLYRNYGDFGFEHVSTATGVTAVGAVYVGFGTMFVDLDLDGAEDLFVANGHVMRHPLDSPVLQKPLLFRNLAGRKMENVAATAGAYTASPHMGRGALATDLDGDGDDDIVVSHINEPAAVLFNDSQPRGRRLTIRLVGDTANRDCIGASAILETRPLDSAGVDPAQSGMERPNRPAPRRLLRQVKGGGSYLSTGPRQLTWGIASGETPTRLTILWPGGERTERPWTADQGRFLIRQTRPDHAILSGMDRADRSRPSRDERAAFETRAFDGR